VPVETAVALQYEAPPEARARAALAAAAAAIESPISARLERRSRLMNLGSAILKLYGPCNLACDYCYEYEGPDQSWRELPFEMSDETIIEAGERFGEYAAEQGLESWPVCLHGGEALMVGKEKVARTAAILRETMARHSTKPDISLVTNGVLLTDAMLETLVDHDIGVTVSLDGGEAEHDRHRKNKAGAGTYKLVAKGINRLRQPEYSHLYKGLLCVIDTANDPIAVYEALRSFDPPEVDFILPYANWDNPPPEYGNIRGIADIKTTPYADWLIQIYDRWQHDKRLHAIAPDDYPAPPGIRFLQSIIDMDFGGESSTEALGLYLGNEVTIRTDGSAELVDGLKSTYDGAVKTGLNVRTDSLRTMAKHLLDSDQMGQVVSQSCNGCYLRDLCGGGHIATRYSTAQGFNNPSVYCQDLWKLINYVRADVSSELTDAQIRADDSMHIKEWSRRIGSGPIGKYLRQAPEAE
jgi:uncharacterized protein